MLEIPDPNSIARVADWVELVVAITASSVSKAQLTSNIEGVAGDEPPEHFLSSVWQELALRQRLYSSPSFTVEDRTVEPLTDITVLPEYLVCLIFSLYGVQGNTKISGKLFERLTSEAVERYLSGKAMVFGWPFGKDDANASSDETQIMQMVKKATEILQEKYIEAPASHYKDRNLDVIGWKPFNEKRSGQVVILVQCGAGHNWKSKNAVPIKAWTQYIHWANDPLVAFSVPCIIDDRDWHGQSREKGILFDRVRILNLLPKGVKDKNLKAEISTWVKEQLPELENE